MKSALFSLLTVVCVLSSCKQQPMASFKTDKTDYYPGDKILITNNCYKLDQYRWTLPDGKTSTEKEPEFIIPVTMKIGTYDISLDASNGSGQSDHISKTITVKPLAALSVWTALNIADSIPVYINNTLKGFAKKSNGAPLDCVQKGYLNIALKPGRYTVTARSSSVTWKSPVDVPESGCAKFELY